MGLVKISPVSAITRPSGLDSANWLGLFLGPVPSRSRCSCLRSRCIDDILGQCEPVGGTPSSLSSGSSDDTPSSVGDR